MKKFLFTAMLVLASGSILGYAQSQAVLRAQPQSARAHLINAYLLEHAERNPSAAASELKLARSLDEKGDVICRNECSTGSWCNT